jgi:heme exporter protein D
VTAAPKVFTVGIGAGLVTGEWMEVAVAGGLVVLAVAAVLTVPSVRKALKRVLRWMRREERIEDGA